MFRSWYNLTMLAAESQRVIWLRSMKLAAGGAKAEREARLIMGASADSVVKGYRRRVKANARRLSK